jgi:hypothetical protein
MTHEKLLRAFRASFVNYNSAREVQQEEIYKYWGKQVLDAAFSDPKNFRAGLVDDYDR